MNGRISDRIHTTEVLIIGGGLTGLRAALAASEAGREVTILWKGPGASPGIMGFNAPVGPQDSEEIFFDDTMRSGTGINRRALARVLVQGTRGVVADLERRGMEFAGGSSGYDLLQPLGCSHPRLVHYNSSTGIEIGKLLLRGIEERGVKIFRGTAATDLIVHDGKVIGACGIDTGNGRFLGFHSKAVVLTTGGCGNLYPLTTYPSDICGDGYAMAFRAGAELIDMEFVQFEPCCFVYPDELKGDPIPTTTLMEGGRLRNAEGEEILKRHGLAADTGLQKDALSRALHSEIAEGRGAEHGGIWLDISMLSREMITVSHSIFYKPALKAGVDLTAEPAEVAPAAHTSMGGVLISESCESSAAGLYAAGEVAGGIHGANRIGGNAGAETLVFGTIAGKSAADYAANITAETDTSNLFQDLFSEKDEEYGNRKSTTPGILLTMRQRVRGIMKSQAGIIRSREGLTTAIAKLREIETLCDSNKLREGEELCEGKAGLSGMSKGNGRDLLKALALENMVSVGLLVTSAALKRNESRGVHYRIDFPTQNDVEWNKNIILKRSEGGIDAVIKPCS